MKNSFKKLLTVYKYLSFVSSIGYWIYIVIDDFHFIEKYWHTHWWDYLVIWTSYFLVYFIALSIYFWLISAAIIFIYHKLIKRLNGNKCRLHTLYKKQA